MGFSTLDGVLRRADNVSILFKPGFFTGKGRIQMWIGREYFRLPAKIHKRDFVARMEQSASHPLLFTPGYKDRQYWLFANQWHWDNEDLTSEEVYALLVTKAQRRSAQIQRAQAMVAMGETPRPTVRGAIPDDVKQFVFMRDEGRCTKCSSNVELQFDHVIPVSLGGCLLYTSDAADE